MNMWSLPSTPSAHAGRRRVAGVAVLLLAVLAGPVEAAGSGAVDLSQRLDPLVVTGTRTAQRLSETPIRTEVLGEAEFRHGGTRCFADAMELLPGARVENNCQNCGTSEILLLGLEQKYTQLLFDGAPLFSGLAGVYGIEQIPTVFLDRIEVVKGGGSAVYGSGAVGGVINLIARRPAQSGGLVELRFDDVKGRPSTLVSAVADHVSGDGRSQFSVFGQRVRTAAVDLNDDGFSDLTKRELEVLGSRLVQRIGPGELRLDYSRTVEFRRGGNKFELPDNLADISERVDTARDAAALAWSADVGVGIDYQIAAGWARIRRQTYYGGLFGREPDEALQPESAPGAGDNEQAFLDRGYATAGQVARDQFGFTRNALANFEAQVNRRRGAHLTSFGVQYFRETLNDLVPVSSFVTDYPAAGDAATGWNAGVFVQDDWRLSEAWQVVLGVRADQNSELERPVVSPRFNVKWNASPELTLRGTVGTGFRAPQAFDEDLHIELIAGDRARTRQAPGLRAERSASALVSAEYAPARAGGRLALEATAFATAIRGTFTNSATRLDPVSGEVFRERFNGPAAGIGGVELNLGAQPLPRLRLDLGGVAQFARFRSPVTVYDDGAGKTVRVRDFLGTPRRYAVLQLTWLNPRLADVALAATYTGAMKEINQRTGELNARTRDFLVWNATLSRRFTPAGFPAFAVSAGVRNLFDDRQRDLESGVHRDPYYLYGPRTPRTLFFGVRAEI